MNDLATFLAPLNRGTARRRRYRAAMTAIDAMIIGATAAMVLNMAIQLIVAIQAGRL
jgi:hypothetical protein